MHHKSCGTVYEILKEFVLPDHIYANTVYTLNSEMKQENKVSI